jgi:FAD dependent oxidoreductase
MGLANRSEGIGKRWPKPFLHSITNSGPGSSATFPEAQLSRRKMEHRKIRGRLGVVTMTSPEVEMLALITRPWRCLFILVAIFAEFLPGQSSIACQSPAEPVDVVIYGGTPAGIAAAIQTERMGKSVILIEPSNHLGGLTTGGLGQTDIGNKAAIGGISREFYVRVRRHYESADAWKWQSRDEYRSMGQSQTSPDESAMWTFEPQVATKIYRDWLEEFGIRVELSRRLDRRAGVVTTRSVPWQILSVRMESGEVYHGKMFIDATYEGDLMAAAGVACTAGREENSKYGETLNGSQKEKAIHHQLVRGVSPFIVPGDPASGLLPFIEPGAEEPDGTGDHRLQACCFRMCMTDLPENRMAWVKPDGYQEQWYELLLRNFEAGESRVPLNIGLMPNRKTDANNNFGFSTDFIGQNYDYPEASYEQRIRIVARHRKYQQGLMWTLANHPRVPGKIREEIARWGMCKDEFIEGGGWQDQLYIREARRMIGDLVMTQHHCQGREAADDPVGLAAYTMDSHHVRRYVDSEGFVRNEGDVQVGGFKPYPIGYRAIVPKADQCVNLLVPVCVSASHIAFGSIRMEPVFMVLGQAAGTAAVQAIDQRVPIQNVDRSKLRRRLLDDGMILD